MCLDVYKRQGAGSIKVEAGAAGKVFKLEAKVGDAVKKLSLIHI